MHAPYFTLFCVRLYGIFRHYLINCTNFGEKLLNIKYVFLFSLQLLSEMLLILRRIPPDIITNVHRSSSKVPAILVTLQSKLNFLDRFLKSNQIPNLTEIRPVGAEFFHADGRTDMTKLMVAFRNSANAPKTVSLLASDVCLDVMNNPLPSDVKKYTRISSIRNFLINKLLNAQGKPTMDDTGT